MMYAPALSPLRSGIFEYDPEKVFALKRQLRGGVFAGKPVNTNSAGFRDEEISRHKERSEVRILLLGDSISFGHGVLAEETFSHHLERLLKRDFPNHTFQVINTGVPGNSPSQEYVDLKRSLEFEPDLIILQFVLNDVAEPILFRKKYGGSGIDYHGIEDLNWLDYALQRNSAFYVLYRKLVDRILRGSLKARQSSALAKGREIDINMAAHPPTNELQELAWSEAKSSWSQIFELAKARALPVLVMVSPCDFQFMRNDQTFANSELAAFATEHGAEVVDVLHSLEAELRNTPKAITGYGCRSLDGELVSEDDCRRRIWSQLFLDYDHYSARGHQFIADVLRSAVVPLLKQRGAL